MLMIFGPCCAVLAIICYYNKSFGFLRCLFSDYLKWNVHSAVALEQSETTILSNVKVPINRFSVSLGECVGSHDHIWTMSLNTDSNNVPIVMLHGFAAGIAFWLMNLEDISADRPLYAIDLLGFGRSSRPNFLTDAERVELQFVDSIEKWREAMKIDSMILLGHSLGGFIATSYAMKYPERIEHLILADPWGFTEAKVMFNEPLWKRSLVFQSLAPLAILRAAGPYGEWLVKKALNNILRKYEQAVEDKNVFAQYIHQCNSAHPSGEEAFCSLLIKPYAAKHPVGERALATMSDTLPITFLYGEKSWMDNKYGEIIQTARPNSYTKIVIIPFAGHYIYSDNALDFNQSVIEACNILKSKQSS